MLCAGIVRVGGVPQCFWAVWDRSRGVLRERTRMRLGAVALPGGAGRGRDGGVAIDLALAPAGAPVAVTSTHGGAEVRTRKAPVVARGSVTLGGRAIAVDAPGLVDDSDGRHARETAWEWCAGAGRDAGGRAVAWNLVAGIHDAPRGSERAVWRDGAPREGEPVAFAPGRGAVGGLRFAAAGGRPRAGGRGAVRGGGGGRPPRPRPVRAGRERVPPAVRDVLGDAARRRGARRGLRRHGAPPGALVIAR